MTNPFNSSEHRTRADQTHFNQDEVRLANRNSGFLLEMLSYDITPIGSHYLLNHFDVPKLEGQTHRIEFTGAFQEPFAINLGEIRQLPKVTLPVTMECSGNGRAGFETRPQSMPWMFEAVGTSEWTGTLLQPLIEKALPKGDVVDIVFSGADRGLDKGVEHFFERSLSLQQLEELEVLLVYEMNGLPLLPQHGAPVRIIVPGWYGMASVKWLCEIKAITHPFDGFQQIGTYCYREDKDAPGRPVQDIRVKSLIEPPGIPDWVTRKRLVEPGLIALSGRAWTGGGRRVVKVEVEINGIWQEASLCEAVGKYAWVKWSCNWDAQSGEYVLRSRATDDQGNVQPLTPPWDEGGFGNNSVHEVCVFVR